MKREKEIHVGFAVKIRAIGVWLFLMCEQRACKNGYLIAPAEARDQFRETIDSLRHAKIISLKTYNTFRDLEKRQLTFSHEEKAVQHVCDILQIVKSDVDDAVRSFAAKCSRVD